MPTNYIVKQGDTLSKIASNYGVSSSQISGYKSGNPNLIYPGEQLVIPTAEPVQPTPPTQPPTQTVVNATGLTGEPLLETAEKTGYNEPVTSPYTTDIAAILEQQKKLVESTQGNNVPTVSTTAEGLGYGTTQSEADALIPEINSLQQQMADLNSQEQKAIAALLNKPISAGFAMGMESRIKRQYAVEKSAVSANLGVKVALAEMLQGKADKMWSHAQDIVNDLTAKDDANVKDIERFYALNQDTLNYLTAQEKTYLDNIREDAKLVAKNAREDYTNKVSEIFAAAKEGLDVSAISGDDISNKSYEDIIAMISNAAQKKLAQDRAQELALKATGGGSGLTDYQRLTSLNSIRSQARQDAGIKLFTNSLQPSYNGAFAAAAMGNSTGDIILMRYVAKLTDPPTGVREEEYKTFKGAQGDLQNLGIHLTKGMIGRGQLTAEGRKQLLSIATALYDNAKSKYENSYSFYDQQAQDLGFAPGTVSPNYTGGSNETKTGTTIMTSPDGKQWSVPNNQIELFKQNGYK
jgi:LysM repeat protein